MTEAIAQLESGHPASALRILDSLTRSLDPSVPPAERSRLLTVQFTLLTEAAFAAGDLALVARAADSAEAWGGRDGKIRESGTALHARGIEQLSRHDTASAMRTSSMVGA